VHDDRPFCLYLHVHVGTAFRPLSAKIKSIFFAPELHSVHYFQALEGASTYTYVRVGTCTY